MMKSTFVGLSIVAIAIECAAAPAFFTDSKVGDFTTGQKLVTCAAYYDFTSGFAASIGKPAAAEHLGNLSRGWTLAGMMLLSSGADSPKFDSKQTAESIKSARLAHLKAKFEMGDAGVMNEMQAEYERDCDSLIPIQENLIQALRQSPQASPLKKK